MSTNQINTVVSMLFVQRKLKWIDRTITALSVQRVFRLTRDGGSFYNFFHGFQLNGTPRRNIQADGSSKNIGFMIRTIAAETSERDYQ